MQEDKYDVVFLWKQNDAGLYGRRPDMIIQELKKQAQIGRVIHFSAPIEITTLVKNTLYGFKQGKTHFPLIFKQTLKAYFNKYRLNEIPSYTYIYKKENSFIPFFKKKKDYETYVKSILEKQHIGKGHKIILWNNPINYDFKDWINWIKPDKIISDVIDDERAWPNTLENKKKMTENYNEALVQSDALFVNCEEVKKRLKEINDSMNYKVHLVPNGGALYEGERRREVPKKLKRLKGPIIGYVGNLSAKIDDKLIEHCAKMHPEWQIVLIGSVHMNKSLLSLKRYNNIHFWGVIPYQEVQNYISHFDVAIIPHKKVEINEAMNPLKLFVYCALGKNVVSTDIPNINELKSIIHVADSEESFVKAIEKVISKPNQFGEKEISLINKNSWNERIKEINQVIFKEESLKNE